jgi:hypothetical protein
MMEGWKEILNREIRSNDNDTNSGSVIEEVSTTVRGWIEDPSASAQGDNINVIPGGVPGKCHTVLVVKSLGKAQFKTRVKEALDSCIRCIDVRKGVVFYTDAWDEKFWENIYSAFETLYEVRGIRFIRVVETKDRLGKDIQVTRVF